MLMALLLSVLKNCFFFVLAEILQEQKWIIAVLFMVPVYASESVSTSSTCSHAYSRRENATGSTRFAFNSKLF